MATLLTDKAGFHLKYKDLLIIENSIKKVIKSKIITLKRNLKKGFKPNDGCVDITKNSIKRYGELFEKVRSIRKSIPETTSDNWDYNEQDCDIYIYHLIQKHFFTQIDMTLDEYLTKTRKVIESDG